MADISEITLPSGATYDIKDATARHDISILKDSASASYTPTGSVSAPTVSVAVNTASVTPISGVGTLPSFTASVANEVLTLGFSAGSLPTKGTAVTVATGIKSASASAPSFTGTNTTITSK